MNDEEFIDYLIDNRKKLGITNVGCIEPIVYSFGLNERDNPNDIERLISHYERYRLEVARCDEMPAARVMDILYREALENKMNSLPNFLDYLDTLDKWDLVDLINEYEEFHAVFVIRLEEVDYED